MNVHFVINAISIFVMACVAEAYSVRLLLLLRICLYGSKDDVDSSGQDDIIHEFLYVAPNPMYLQASVYNVRVVEYILLLSGMMV